MFRTIRRLAVAAAATLIVSAGVAASPASATRLIQQSANYTCSNANVAVSPPRVWAERGRPEQVIWAIQLERWNGASWNRYSVSTFRATFDYFGRSPTSWSMFNTRTGGRYINSRMHIRVAHRGYYRVGSVVATAYRNSAAYVGGTGAYCWMP
jgi:hypothetical protein